MKIDDQNVMGIIPDQKVTRVMHAAIPIERRKECKPHYVYALRIMIQHIMGGSLGYSITLASIEPDVIRDNFGD